MVNAYHKRDYKGGVCVCGIKQCTSQKERHNFYVKTLNWKKLRGGREEFTIICRLQELQELYAHLSVGLNWRKEDLASLVAGEGLFMFDWSLCLVADGTGVILVTA